MKGQLKLFSKLGAGTVAIVCIPTEAVPISATIDPVESSIDSKSSSSWSKPRILIVDDQKFNLVVLKNHLAKLGFENIDTASNGKETLEAYIQAYHSGRPYKFITMDIEMPVMNGKDAVRKIRAFEESTNIARSYILFISGNVGELEIRECLDHQNDIKANGFLKKPLTLEELRQFINLS